MISLMVTCHRLATFVIFKTKLSETEMCEDEYNLKIIFWFSFNQKEILLNKEYILSIPFSTVAALITLC
jgi:hypothetical protein